MVALLCAVFLQSGCRSCRRNGKLSVSLVECQRDGCVLIVRSRWGLRRLMIERNILCSLMRLRYGSCRRIFIGCAAVRAYRDFVAVIEMSVNTFFDHASFSFLILLRNAE